MLSAERRAARLPHHASEIPEIHRRIIGDEESLAVDALVVQGLDVQLRGRGEGARREQVAVGHVLDVGEIEQVLVVAELEPGLAVAVHVDHGRDQLHVAGAEDGGRTDGDGEEFGGCGGSVCGEN